MRATASPPTRAAFVCVVIILIAAQWPASARVAITPAADQIETAYEALPDFDLRARHLPSSRTVDPEQKKQLLKASRNTVAQATLRDELDREP